MRKANDSLANQDRHISFTFEYQSAMLIRVPSTFFKNATFSACQVDRLLFNMTFANHS
jgi:hypothetical protein